MIVVSHRGPYRFFRNDDGTFRAARGAGGVVSALGPILLDRDHEATWIAAALSSDDVDAAREGATKGLGVDLRLVELDEMLHRLHYDVVSNGVLWFLYHGMFDTTRRPRFDLRFREAWEAFVRVNEAFADEVSSAARDGDLVLVQDYQLTLVPALLRDRRPDLHVVHFSHTPFCGPEDMRILPTDIAEQLCASLAGGPEGFHTARWARSYQRSVREVLGRRATVHPPFVASLGPDVQALQDVAASDDAHRAAAALDDLVGDRLVVLRTDRIEPSKNLVRGFLAFDRLLEARPGLRGRVVFVAMVYPSRQALPEYLAYASEVEQAVTRVNERWATPDWTPVVLDDRDDFARSVAGMQRYDVLFVNPIRDGLNLVAMEGPVLNRRDGIVCLSREAGAFDDLHRAVLPVHPFDIEQTAVALDDALAMPLDERSAMASRLRIFAESRSPATWLAELLRHAS